MKDIIKGIDDLYSLFKKRKRIPLKEAAALLEIPPQTALQWAKALQEDGILDVEFVKDEAVLVWMSADAKALPQASSEDELRKKPLKEAEKEFEALVEEYKRKMDEIKGKSAELQTLGKEKASIIYTRYIPLERRFEAELQLLHDQLSEKEKQISDLEERIRKVPTKMASVEEHAKKLEEIEGFAKRNVADSKKRIQGEIGRIKELQDIVEKSMQEVALRVEEQTLKLKLVEKEIIRLKKIEQWMEMQQNELEAQLADLGTTKKASLKQYSAIKAVVTSDYIKSYITDLTKVKERHAKEIYDIKRREEELSEKITKARKELAALSGESRVIMERFERIAHKKREKAAPSDIKEFQRDLDAVAVGNIE